MCMCLVCLCMYMYMYMYDSCMWLHYARWGRVCISSSRVQMGVARAPCSVSWAACGPPTEDDSQSHRHRHSSTFHRGQSSKASWHLSGTYMASSFCAYNSTNNSGACVVVTKIWCFFFLACCTSKICMCVIYLFRKIFVLVNYLYYLISYSTHCMKLNIVQELPIIW